MPLVQWSAIFNKIELYRKADAHWFTVNHGSPMTNILTWAAYNLLILKDRPTSTICPVTLYPAPPVDYSNLYQVLC